MKPRGDGNRIHALDLAFSGRGPALRGPISRARATRASAIARASGVSEQETKGCVRDGNRIHVRIYLRISKQQR